MKEEDGRIFSGSSMSYVFPTVYWALSISFYFIVYPFKFVHMSLKTGGTAAHATLYVS